MKIVDNYNAQIWLGLREGYTDSYVNDAEIYESIRKFCEETKHCVTVSKTNFFYPGGEEPGLVIGFINYARFPRSESEIRGNSIKLAEILKEKAKQFRVSITFNKTIGGSMMIGDME